MKGYPAMTRDPQQLLAQVVGAVLTLVGAAGFLTGGTLLIFGINTLHNLVHLLSGVLGLAAGFYAGGQWARYYNQGFGVVYLLVTVLGFAAPALAALDTSGRTRPGSGAAADRLGGVPAGQHPVAERGQQAVPREDARR